MKPWLRLTLITLTVGGGFAGAALTLDLLLSGRYSTHGAELVVFALLNAFVLTSGLLLVSRPRVTLPVIFALLLQVPRFLVGGIGYQFYAGLLVSLNLSLTHADVAFAYQLGSAWHVSLQGSGPSWIGVNFVPVFLLLALFVGWVGKPQGAVSLSARVDEQLTEEQGPAAPLYVSESVDSATE